MSDINGNLAQICADMTEMGLDAIRNNRVVSGPELIAFAKRIIAAAAAEASKLIPAERIEFSDMAGRRTIAAGWVKPMEGLANG